MRERAASLVSDSDPRGVLDPGTLLRFAAVGAVTTILDMAVFAILTAWSAPVAVANILSYSCGIALSYALNRRWTFGGSGSLAKASKFVAATLVGLGLSTLLIVAISAIVPPLAAKAASVPPVFLWNYLVTRLWVFRDASA